jgi:hypothetical protein
MLKILEGIERICREHPWSANFTGDVKALRLQALIHIFRAVTSERLDAETFAAVYTEAQTRLTPDQELQAEGGIVWLGSMAAGRQRGRRRQWRSWRGLCFGRR